MWPGQEQSGQPRPAHRRFWETHAGRTHTCKQSRGHGRRHAGTAPGAAVAPVAARSVPSATPVCPTRHGGGVHARPPCLPPHPHRGLSHAPSIALTTHGMHLPGPDTCSTEQAPESARRTAGQGAGAPPAASPTPWPTLSLLTSPVPHLPRVREQHDTDRPMPGRGVTCADGAGLRADTGTLP